METNLKNYPPRERRGPDSRSGHADPSSQCSADRPSSYTFEAFGLRGFGVLGFMVLGLMVLGFRHLKAVKLGGVLAGIGFQNHFKPVVQGP